MSALTPLALLALLPAMAGPLDAGGPAAIEAQLCGSGTAIVINAAGQRNGPRLATVCCAKGCRSRRRRMLDREQ